MPTSTSNGIEVGDPAYQRLPITLNVNGTQAEQLSTTTFPGATQDWGFVTGFGIFNGHTGNDLIFYDTSIVYLVREHEQYIINLVRLTFTP